MQGRSDMWVLDSMLTEREFVSPCTESESMWPHMWQGRQVFLTNTFSNVKADVVAALTQLSIDRIPENRVSRLHIPIDSSRGEGGTAVIHVTLCRRYELLSKLFGPMVDMHVAEAVHGEDARRCDMWACIAFCSYRFDELQHCLLGMKNKRLNWEGWTVEEDVVSAKHLTFRIMQFSIRRRVFLFDKQASMLSPRRLEPLAYMVCEMLPQLPEDVSRTIASHVHRQTTRVSVREFNVGCSEGVFNYATARLLRVARVMNYRKRIRCGKVPSLLQYFNMNQAQREEIYPIMISALRRRQQVFGRVMCTKRTRSGRAY